MVQRSDGSTRAALARWSCRIIARSRSSREIYKNVVPGSVLYTDALRSYRQADRDYIHRFIDHSLRYAEGRVHTNTIENFWSCVKRTLHGTYIAPRAFHLNAYLDESVFRFNNRELPDAARLDETMKGVEQVSSGARLRCAKSGVKLGSAAGARRTAWRFVMNSSLLGRLTVGASCAVLIAALAAPGLANPPVTVTLNGNQLNLNPPPTERAGRIFVPLRGVFENLGASVVYAGGVINATGRGHTVSLRIGSQQATVDGRTEPIDVAPFIIGASTYVPLRFVSQALGAAVDWDNANRVVAISATGANVVSHPADTTLTPSPDNYGERGSITLTNVFPGRGQTVSSRRPTIEARFGGGSVEPSSLRIVVDQVDVTNDATRSQRYFSYVPREPLAAGEHRVRITGDDANGNAFTRGWSFTSGTSTATVEDIRNVRPQNGATVPRQFVVSGRTTPGARVMIQIGATQQPTVGRLIGMILGGTGGSNSDVYDVVADPNGTFSAQITIGAPSGSSLGLVINATDARTGASATPVQETLTVR